MATTVKAILKIEKMNKAGEAPVYLRITKDRKAKYVAIGVQVKPQNWDKGLSRPLSTTRPTSTRSRRTGIRASARSRRGTPVW